MPSLPHEALVLLFRNHPQLAPELLRDALCATLPEYSDVKVASADLTEVQPAEYRADLVLLLSSAAPVLGLIVEVQLSVDDRKRFTWPAYVAILRARHRCPVCLLVVCPNRVVAEWAGRPIHMGCTNMFMPRVLPLHELPEITDDANAAKDPELTVLSAIGHGHDVDAKKAAQIATIALGVAAALDPDRSDLYFDLIQSSLSEAARTVLQETMRTPGNNHTAAFAKRFYNAQGRAQIITRQLTARFGPLSEQVKYDLVWSTPEELDAIGDRLLTAATLQEALTPKS